MSGYTPGRLDGEDLIAARRTLAIALMLEAHADVVAELPGVLPAQDDLSALAEVIGWPGTPRTSAVLAPAQLNVLRDATLGVLAISASVALEQIREAFSGGARAQGVGEDLLTALDRITAFALRLHALVEHPEHESAAGADATTRLLVAPAMGALAEAVVLPVCIIDEACRLEWVNATMAEILGTDPDAAPGTPYLDWCAPEDHARAERALRAALMEQRRWSLELGIGPAGGPYTRLLVIAAPRTGPDGTFCGWTALGFDIGRNAGLREHLSGLVSTVSVEAARMRLLLNQFPGVIWTYDRDLRLTSSLGAGVRVIGEPPNHNVGRTIEEIFGYPGCGERSVAAHRLALAGEPQHYLEQYGERVFECWVEPLRDAADQIIGCIGIGIDISGRLADETRRAELHRQLELSQRIAALGSWEIDLTTGEVLWSDEAYRLLGMQPGVVAPSFDIFMAAVHPDDRLAVHNAYQGSIQHGDPITLEYRIIRSDGAVRRMTTIAAVESDDGGTPVRVLGTLQDITAQAEERDRLAETTRLLAFSQQLGSIGSWEIDLATQTSRWSDETYRILGTQPGAVIPSVASFYGFVHPDDLGRVRAAQQQSFAAGVDFTAGAFRVRRPDGSVRWVHSGLRFEVDATGAPLRAIGIIQDITDLTEERRRAETLTGHLQMAQEVGHLGSWEVDLAGDDHVWSDEAFRLLGLEPGVAPPTFATFLQCVHPEDRERLTARHVQGMVDGKGFEVDYRVIRASDAAHRDMHGVVRFLCGVGGVPYRALGVLQDVTELLRRDRDLQQAGAQTATAAEGSGRAGGTIGR